MVKKQIFLLLLILFSAFNIYAQQKVINLSEVEIKSKKAARALYGIDTISIKSIEKISLYDVGSVLKTFTNVSAIKKGALGLDPVIRGFRFSELNVLINGTIKVEGGCPNRMDPALSHVDVTELKKVKVLKGPYALKFGPSFGGTINLITWTPVFKEKYKTNIKGIVGLQSNGSGYKSKIQISGANKIFTYQVSAGKLNYNDYKDGKDNYINSSVSGFDLTGNLGFKISKKQIIDAGVIISRGYNVDFPSLSMDEREDNTNIYNINYSINKVGNKINFIKISSWLSDVNHIMDNKNRPFSDTVVAISSIDATDAGVRVSLNITTEKGVIETGMDHEYIYKNGERVKTMIKQPGLPVKNENLWKNAYINNTGLYGKYILPGARFDWLLGLRFDFNMANSDTLLLTSTGDPIYMNGDTKSNFINYNINAGFNWHVNNNNDLSASLGRGSRSPDMTERFIILLPVGYDKFDYLGNPKLKPEENYELNITFKNTDKIYGTIDATWFFSYVTNYIGSRFLPPSQQRPNTPGVLGVKEFVNIDKVWLTGFEFNYFTPQNKRWQLNFNAAYTYGRNPKAQGYEIESGQIVDTYIIINDPLPEIPPFEFNLNFKYGFFNNKLIPELHWRAVASQKKISASYGEQKSPSFQLVDLKLKYKFNNYFIVYTGVNNILNKYYFEHLNRNIIGSTKPLYEPGINFFINMVVNL
jgi:iron complex outermembrane receptor protein